MKKYQSTLGGIKELKFFEQDLENTTPWFIDVMVDRREELMAFLKKMVWALG